MRTVLGLCGAAVLILSSFPGSAAEMHADDGSLTHKGTIYGEAWMGSKRLEGAKVRFYNVDTKALVGTAISGAKGEYSISLPADAPLAAIAEHDGFTSDAYRAWGFKPGKRMKISLFVKPENAVADLENLQSDFGFLHILPQLLKKTEVTPGDSQLLEKRSASIPEGCIAYYPLDGSAQDASGNGHHGKAEGVAWTSDRNGIEGAAGLFRTKGTGGAEIHVQENDDLDLVDSFSIAAWVRARQPDWIDNIVTKHKSESKVPGEWHLCMVTEHGQSKFAFSAINGKSYESQTFDATKWTHVACCFDKVAERLIFYVNGTPFGEYATPDVGVRNTSVRLEIGGEAGGHYRTPNWDGEIDEVFIYRRALSLPEVRRLMDGK